jgi:hypothetical protein
MNYLANISRSPGDPKIVSSGGPSSFGAADQLGNALGWFSYALGALELAAPHVITRALGLRGREGLVRAFGAREMGAGMMSLSIDRAAGLWSRVAGDALDIAVVMSADRRDNPKRDNVRLALGILAVVTIVDVFAAKAVTARHARGTAPPRDYSDRSGFPRGLAQARGLASRAGTRSQAPSPARA